MALCARAEPPTRAEPLALHCRYSPPSMRESALRSLQDAARRSYGVGVTPPVLAKGAGAGTGGSMKAPRWGTTPTVLVSVIPTA